MVLSSQWHVMYLVSTMNSSILGGGGGGGVAWIWPLVDHGRGRRVQLASSPSVVWIRLYLHTYCVLSRFSTAPPLFAFSLLCCALLSSLMLMIAHSPLFYK